MLNEYIKSPSFWDYRIKKSDLKKPEVKKFWLERKINMADWKGISRKDLKDFLPVLNIRLEFKKLLTVFLENAK